MIQFNQACSNGHHQLDSTRYSLESFMQEIFMMYMIYMLGMFMYNYDICIFNDI